MDKGPALDNCVMISVLTPDKIAVIGDDLNDLPLFQRVGFSACPKDAHSYIQKIASIVCIATADTEQVASFAIC